MAGFLKGGLGGGLGLGKKDDDLENALVDGAEGEQGAGTGYGVDFFTSIFQRISFYPGATSMMLLLGNDSRVKRLTFSIISGVTCLERFSFCVKNAHMNHLNNGGNSSSPQISPA